MFMSECGQACAVIGTNAERPERSRAGGAVSAPVTGVLAPTQFDRQKDTLRRHHERQCPHYCHENFVNIDNFIAKPSVSAPVRNQLLNHSLADPMPGHWDRYSQTERESTATFQKDETFEPFGHDRMQDDHIIPGVQASVAMPNIDDLEIDITASQKMLSAVSGSLLTSILGKLATTSRKQ